MAVFYIEVTLLILTFSLCSLYSCPILCKCSLLKTKAERKRTGQRVICSPEVPLSSVEDINLEEMPEDLIYLYIRGNQFKTILRGSFSSVPGIIKLDLSRNAINEIQNEAFFNLTHLKILDLSKNKLLHLSSGMFDGLSALQKLVLEGNLLSSFDEGTFVHVRSLQVLDLLNNPIMCDCHIKWLLDWKRAKKIKISRDVKCYFPISMKNFHLSDLYPKDLHCNYTVMLPVFNINPKILQLTFEGDPLIFQCQASNVDQRTQLLWYLDGVKVIPDLLRTIVIETQVSQDIILSSLHVEHLHLEHSGTWSCITEVHERNESQSVQVIVIAHNTLVCPQTVTSENKGKYIWPETLAGITVQLECQDKSFQKAYAYHTCTTNGVWKHLNTTACPYVSKVTRSLEQFFQDSSSLKVEYVLNNANNLRNFTNDSSIMKDKMDIILISHTVKNYLPFVSLFKELGEIMIDIISTVMFVDKKILRLAEMQDKACSRFVEVIESIPRALSEGSFNAIRKNLAIMEFIMNAESFGGLTCSFFRSYESNKEISKDKRNFDPSDEFQCTMMNTSSLSNSISQVNNDMKLEASVALSSFLFHHEGIQDTKYKFQFIVYQSNALFPRPSEKSDVMEVISSVITAKIVFTSALNLSSPVIVTLRANHNTDLVPVWWDSKAFNGEGDWSTNNCAIASVSMNLVTFTCKQLGSFGLLQDIKSSVMQRSWHIAQFRLCHPAICVGSLICVMCLMISILFYYQSCQLNVSKKMKHSFVNTWCSIILLCIIFSLGVVQTSINIVCESIGLLLHYLSLCTLLWMIISANNLYKEITKTNSPKPSEEELPIDLTLPPKPMIRFYLLGYGVPIIICGISAAVHLESYKGPLYCFLSLSESLLAFYSPALVLVFLLLIFYISVSCVLSACNKKEGSVLASNENHPCLVSTEIKDFEDFSHKAQLRGNITTFLLFIFCWASGALAVGGPFGNYVDELVFNIMYCLFASLLGFFVLLHFCFPQKKFYYCLINKQNKANSSTEDLPTIQMDVSVPSTQEALMNKAESSVEINKSKISDLSADSFDKIKTFYNPHQSVVAKRFFEKNRKQCSKQKNKHKSGDSTHKHTDFSDNEIETDKKTMTEGSSHQVFLKENNFELNQDIKFMNKNFKTEPKNFSSKKSYFSEMPCSSQKSNWNEYSDNARPVSSTVPNSCCSEDNHPRTKKQQSHCSRKNSHRHHSSKRKTPVNGSINNLPQVPRSKILFDHSRRSTFYDQSSSFSNTDANQVELFS